MKKILLILIFIFAVFSTNFSSAEWISYPPGSYAMWPAYKTLPSEITSNEGFVGIYLQFVWSDVEKEDNVFEWSKLDARISEAEKANLKVILSIRADLTHAPQWLKNDPQVQKIELIASNSYLKTSGQKLALPLFWDPIYHAKKKSFIQALGQRYSSNPAVVAVTVGFANMDTDDWGVPHEDAKTLMKKYGVDYDNEQAWLDKGYTTEMMLRIGKEIIDSTAEAFPNQALKLPIGIHGKGLKGADLLDQILEYAYEKYPQRFYIQANRLDTAVPLASDSVVDHSDRYGKLALYKILKKNSPHIGIQMIAAASLGNKDHCRQNHGESPCSPQEVMKNSIEIALSYKPTFLEYWPEDSVNAELKPLYKDATLRMGGKLRKI